MAPSKQYRRDTIARQRTRPDANKQNVCAGTETAKHDEDENEISERAVSRRVRCRWKKSYWPTMFNSEIDIFDIEEVIQHQTRDNNCR